MTNAGHSRYAPGRRLGGDRPGAYWEVDFTEVKPAKYGNKYLLVFIDTFSGWVEAYPTKKETANVVAKKPLEDIITGCGLPTLLGSDNGPALTNLTLETGSDWVSLLPYALYRARNTPYTLGPTLFEILYGRPPPLLPNLQSRY